MDDAGKRQRGQPTKLTRELKDRLVGKVRNGFPIDAVCESEGIHPESYRNWMRWGERKQAKKAGKLYVEFFEEVTRARGEAQLRYLAQARAGDGKGESNGRARCAQWLLERLYGNRYAPRIQLKVQEELESLLDVVERTCAEKDCGCFEAILGTIAARARGEEASDLEGEEGGSSGGEGGPPPGSSTEVVH